MGAISDNHFSLDEQIEDAIAYLTDEQYEAFRREFPEYDEGLIWSGSWVDTERSGVDPEFMSWVADWIESNTNIYWEDGEPWLDDEN